MKFTTRIYALLGAVLISMLACREAGAQEIAIKTNVLKLAALTPNLGAEFVIGEKSTIDFSLMGHINPYGLPSKMFSIQPEYRFWISGRPMINAFIGATAHVSIHNMTVHDQKCEGCSTGLGVTAGYVIALGRKWNIEFSGGVAASCFFQKQYTIDNRDHIIPNIPEKNNSFGYKFLPTDLGVTLIYIIK